MNIEEYKTDLLKGEINDILNKIEEFSKFYIAKDYDSLSKSYTVDGKYVIVWKKENGTWKIYLDIWNRL